MSACISREGEFSDHELTNPDDPYCCTRCWHVDDQAMLARIREVEAERDEVAGRLSALLCDLTGGLLSKPTYPVETMRQEIEAFLERQFEADTKANLTEQGRRLASQRDDLIAQGVDPADLVVPLAPEVGGKPSHGWTCNCGECVLECTCAMTEASQRTCAAHGEDEWRAPEAAE